MKSVFKRIVACTLLFVFAVSMSACVGTKNNEITVLINKFENSCNKLDLNSMLDCLEPKMSETIKVATGFVGMFAGKDTDELLNSFAKLIMQDGPVDARSFFSSIKINVENVLIDESVATATSTVKYTISGEDYQKNAVFECEYSESDKKWYIADIDIE